MQDSKKISVKHLGTPGTVDVDLLPWDTAANVLCKSGAGPEMLLSPAPQMGIVYAPDEALWEAAVSGQLLYAIQPRLAC